MTDTNRQAPTFESVTADAEMLFSMGKTATNEEAANLRAAIGKLLNPKRGSSGH